MRASRRRGRLRRVETVIGATGKYLGLIGTALKLAQLAPAAVALAVVFFSPSAWLSDTLRRWSLAGVVAGSAAGMGAWAAVRTRVADPGRLGAGLLLLGLASVVALRFHLALVDLAFVTRWPVLQPLHDFFLGTDLGERLYNLGTAAWFGLALFLATLGLPLYARGRADRRGAAAATAPDTHALHGALATLTDGIVALERANEALRDENERLRERLMALEAPADDPPPARAPDEHAADAAPMGPTRA
jgi:hypothetical protein